MVYCYISWDQMNYYVHHMKYESFEDDCTTSKNRVYALN